LETAKRVQRASAGDLRAMDQRVSTLWALMGERFWLERDLTRVESMIEAVIVELENQAIA